MKAIPVVLAAACFSVIGFANAAGTDDGLEGDWCGVAHVSQQPGRRGADSFARLKYTGDTFSVNVMLVDVATGNRTSDRGALASCGEYEMTVRESAMSTVVECHPWLLLRAASGKIGIAFLPPKSGTSIIYDTKRCAK